MALAPFLLLSNFSQKFQAIVIPALIDNIISHKPNQTKPNHDASHES